LSFGGDDSRMLPDQLAHIQQIEKTEKCSIVGKFMIPSKQKERFRVYAERMGINSNHIFPDMTGIGQHLSRLRCQYIQERILDSKGRLLQ
jgi:hypothetical protein